MLNIYSTCDGLGGKTDKQIPFYNPSLIKLEIITSTLIFHNSVYSTFPVYSSLPVNKAPVFTVQPQSRVALEGSEVELQCRVQGKPAPRITWYKDGEVLTGASQQDMGGNEIQSQISIPNVRMSHEGEYKVEAENDVDKAVSAFHLTGI